MKTLYYKTNTYEMPNDMTFQDFIEEVKRNPYIALRLFKEERCMAPYFIREDVQNVLLKIEDPDRIIESEGTLYFKEEYDRKLRGYVKKKCPGCVRYDGDSGSLKGNDVEMTLDGLCFQRQEEQTYNFKLGVEAFWKKFAAMEKKLRSLVKKGQITEAKNQVKEIFNRHVGASGEILFGIGSRHTVMMMSGLNNSMVQCVLDYVICRAPQELGEKWLFFSSINRECYQYQPSGDYDASKHPIRVSRKMRNVDRTRFEVVFVADKEEDQDPRKANIENYIYICSQIGENLLQNIVSDMSFSYTERFDDEISLEEFYVEILNTYMTYEIETYTREQNVYSYKFTPTPKSLMRGETQESFTSCRDLTFKVALYDENEVVDSYLNQLNLICAYLEINLTQDEAEGDRRLGIMYREILFDLEESGIVKKFSYELTENKLYVDMLVMDAGICRQEIRKRSPELEQFECYYTEINHDRRKTYRVSYDMEEIKTNNSRLN